MRVNVSNSEMKIIDNSIDAYTEDPFFYLFFVVEEWSEINCFSNWSTQLLLTTETTSDTTLG